MLLESVLAELSIGILDDHQQQMLFHDTTPPPAAAQYVYNYRHRVVLEMCSPSESSSELLESSGKPIARHAGKEERQNGSSTRDMMHFSEDQEKYNWYRAPGRVPFTWEIQPGVPKTPQRKSESRNDDEDQSSPVPLRLPPSAAILASSNSIGTASSSAPMKKAGGCFSWNLFHLSTQSVDAREGCVQGDIKGYDDDIVPSNLELDSNEEWSPVSTLELPQSPGANCTTLLWGYKCIFVAWLKHKGKKKQPEWATGHPGHQDSKLSSSSHDLKMILEASQPVRQTRALKKKSSRSSSCNRNCCHSTAGMDQVRFSVEMDAYNFSYKEEGGTVPPPNLMDWASYGLV